MVLLSLPNYAVQKPVSLMQAVSTDTSYIERYDFVLQLALSSAIVFLFAQDLYYQYSQSVLNPTSEPACHTVASITW